MKLQTVNVHKIETKMDVDGNPVSIGDKVICVDAEASFYRLGVGCEYLVEANFDGSPTVMVNRASHSMDRFRLVR